MIVMKFKIRIFFALAIICSIRCEVKAQQIPLFKPSPGPNNALILSIGKAKTNVDYVTVFDFTVKSITQESIVAFELGSGKDCPVKYKVKLAPSQSYTATLNETNTCQSRDTLKVLSFVTDKGEKVSIFYSTTLYPTMN